jgi:hypothetical protein
LSHAHENLHRLKPVHALHRRIVSRDETMHFPEARSREMSAMLVRAIVVGARCAGVPMAILLARRGCRVLLVDRATFPSDTISTP